MQIDGVSGGVSGIPPSMWEGEWSLEEEAQLFGVPFENILKMKWLLYTSQTDILDLEQKILKMWFIFISERQASTKQKILTEERSCFFVRIFIEGYNAVS